MTLDLSSLSSWIWIVLGLLLVLVAARFFLHLIVRILGFFWHVGIALVVLFLLYFALHAMHVI